MKNFITFFSMFAVFISSPAKGDTGNVKRELNDGVTKSEMDRLPVEAKLDCKIAGKGVWVNLSFRNLGLSDVKVWKRNLISDGKLTWSAFVVSRNGEKVPYKGKTVKAATPSSADYILIKPGETKSTEIGLDMYYDLHPPGNYRVQYRAVQPNPVDGKLSMTLSNVVDLEIL